MLVSQGYTEDNTLVIDVVLQYRINGGEWINATADNFPSDGITVTLDYPDGTDSSYDFMVVHMFTVTSERLGITAGEVEMPEVTKTDEGIVITLNGLSPVMISWKAATTEVATTSENDEPASEEDEPAGVEEDTTGAEETPASEEAASSSENDVSTTEKEAATTSENEATTSEDDNSNESAQTGDSGKLAIWFTVISLIGLTGARTYRRRKRVN